MKFIKPSFEIWKQTDTPEGILKQIEKVGRVCYKSEDKITENSAETFVNNLIKNKHYAMLEHGTVYLIVPNKGDEWINTEEKINAYDVVLRYAFNKYSSVVNENGCTIADKEDFCNSNFAYITSNYRVLVENEWEDDLIYLSKHTELHHKRVTVHFTCDCGVGREFTRHRKFSFAQESTRYCNFSKDKFNNELTFIVYPWSTPEDVTEVNCVDEDFWKVCEQAEKSYMNLIKLGWKPEQARIVLPLATKTELIMTGFVEDWLHFFNLRAKGTTGKPHPQAKELAEPLLEEFIKLGYIVA